jgi:Fungal N-terminal domain of STAND proteins
MEPLSLTASIIAVLTAANTVAHGLVKLRGFKNAPDELLALMNEVSDLQVILEEVNEISRTQGVHGDRLSLNLAQLLIRAKSTLLKLHRLIRVD